MTISCVHCGNSADGRTHVRAHITGGRINIVSPHNNLCGSGCRAPWWDAPTDEHLVRTVRAPAVCYAALGETLKALAEHAPEHAARAMEVLADPAAAAANAAFVDIDPGVTAAAHEARQAAMTKLFALMSRWMGALTDSGSSPLTQGELNEMRELQLFLGQALGTQPLPATVLRGLLVGAGRLGEMAAMHAGVAQGHHEEALCANLHDEDQDLIVTILHEEQRYPDGTIDMFRVRDDAGQTVALLHGRDVERHAFASAAEMNAWWRGDLESTPLPMETA